MNLLSRVKSFLIIPFLAMSFTSNAQDDFESKINRKLIENFKIKEIKSHLYPEGTKPGDSMLVDHLFFKVNGLCNKEITTDYVNTFEYNLDGLKIKELSERKGIAGQSIIVFNYDTKGNMILSERIQEGYKDPLNYITYKHRLTFDTKNRLVKDEWVDKSGKAQINERREYLQPEPDSGIVEVIKYYDMYEHPYRIGKTYDDGRMVMYNVGDDKNFISYELFLDDLQRVVKLIDYYHKGPHAYDMVREFGHGIITTSKVTELYNYNKYGLIAEKLTYENGIVIEKQTWHYIL